MWIKLQNEGAEPVTIKAGESLVQAIFMKYLITDSDGNLNIERTCYY